MASLHRAAARQRIVPASSWVNPSQRRRTAAPTMKLGKQGGTTCPHCSAEVPARLAGSEYSGAGVRPTDRVVGQHQLGGGRVTRTGIPCPGAGRPAPHSDV